MNERHWDTTEGLRVAETQEVAAAELADLEARGYDWEQAGLVAGSGWIVTAPDGTRIDCSRDSDD